MITVTTENLKKIASNIKSLVNTAESPLKHTHYLKEIATSLGFKNWEHLVSHEATCSKVSEVSAIPETSSHLLCNETGIFDLVYDAFRLGFVTQPSEFLALDALSLEVVDTSAYRDSSGALVMSSAYPYAKSVVLVSYDCFADLNLVAPRPYLMTEVSRYLDNKGIKWEFSGYSDSVKNSLLDEAVIALGFAILPKERELLKGGVVYGTDLFMEWFSPVPNPTYDGDLKDAEFISDFIWSLDIKAEVFEAHKANPGTVWSIIEDDYGNTCIQNGYRLVNREGFLITKTPFNGTYLGFWNEDDLAMSIDAALENEEDD